MKPLRLASAVLFSLLAIIGTSCRSSAPQQGKAIHLLKPNSFYSFLKDFGADKDPDHVFTWQKDGTLRISGQYYGYMATKQPYSNYVLIAEFKWGEKTWAPRENNARDGGVLCHFIGKDGVWPTSL